MPYPRHFLLNWGGDFVSDPNEIWSNGIRFCKDDNLDGATTPTLTSAQYSSALDTLVPKIQSHMQNNGSAYSSNTRLKYVKLNAIDANGGYEDKVNSHTRFLPGAGVVSSTGSQFPLSTALCVTFLTAAERGPGSKGRVFVPHPALALGTNFRVLPAALNTYTAQWKTFLQSLSDWGFALSPSTPKASVLSAVGAGSARNITRVQIGDVLDYMGSRRNRLVESRVTTASFDL